MAYAGYLLKIGTYTFPTSLIKADSYSAYKSVTDLDSFVDATGELHRNALSHFGYKCEFDTIPMMNNTQFAALMANIYSQFTDSIERKATVSMYIPETDSYADVDAYMPDIKPQMYFADATKILFDSIRFAFISY